jgi:hypothetical protein
MLSYYCPTDYNFYLLLRATLQNLNFKLIWCTILVKNNYFVLRPSGKVPILYTQFYTVPNPGTSKPERAAAEFFASVEECLTAVPRGILVQERSSF